MEILTTVLGCTAAFIFFIAAMGAARDLRRYRSGKENYKRMP